MSTIVEIPLSSDQNALSYDVILNGEKFRLETIYNKRGEFWTLNIKDKAGSMLVSGLKMIADWPLSISKDYTPNLPRGTFILYDISGLSAEAGQNDLGDRHRLIFVEELLDVSISDVISALNRQGITVAPEV